MKKSMLVATLSLLGALTFSNQATAGDSLKCYSFMGVTYKTVDYNNAVHEVEDNTKVVFENSTPIVNSGADIVLGDANFVYDAHLQGDYFRLELTDKTNGQVSEYFGPSSSLKDGVDTCVFMTPTKDSGLRPAWNDLEHAKIGDVITDSLRLQYLTVQCNIVQGQVK